MTVHEETQFISIAAPPHAHQPCIMFAIQSHEIRQPMADKFGVRESFDLYGAFWKPEEPDSKFTGRLARNKQVIELTTSPTFKALTVDDLPSLFERERQTIEVLHGTTEHGPCTLFWLQSLSPGGRTDLQTLEVIEFRTFRVSLCIFGLHISSATAPILQSACFGYSSLQEWIPRRPEREQTGDHITLTHSLALPAAFDVCSTAERIRIELDVVPRMQHHASGEYQVRNEPQLTVEPAEPRSVEWFLDIAYRFENFFSVLLGTSVCVLSIAAKHEGEVGWFVRRIRNKMQKPDPTIWVRCDGSQLAEAALRWLSTPEEFRSFENLVYGTIRNSSLYVETEFLSLAQALESFHRLTDPVTIVTPESFDGILRSVKEAIHNICRAESEIASKLDECVQHANDVSFQQRIKGLFSRLNGDNLRRLLGSPEEFEQTLRQTRNYFTHAGIRKQTKVLIDAGKLFLFNQKLHALLRLLVLVHLGFPESIVFEPIFQQSRKWA